MTGAPLTPGDLERMDGVAKAALAGRWTVPPEDFTALLSHVRSLTVERDALAEGEKAAAKRCAEAVAGLIDAACGLEDERDDLRARLTRAREALGSFDENPPHYRAGHLVEGEWRIRQARALAALRAALAEPPGVE